MRTFWRLGYGATSISEITATTGMHPGAIYTTFGDKRGLLLAALARYREVGTRRVRALLSGSPSPLDGIRAYLLDQASLSNPTPTTGDNDTGRGCLAGNSALELLPGDPAIAEALRLIFDDLHSGIAEAVRAAQRLGEISDRWPAADVASHLLAVVEGMFVVGRVFADPGRARAVAELTIQALRASEPEGMAP
jgi:TetR/AcrR family transcriptional repressor of nem operon